MYNTLPQTVTGELGEEHEEDVTTQLDWNDYDTIVEMSDLSTEATFVSTKRSLIENFNGLKESEAMAKQHEGIHQSKWVVNLLSRVLIDAKEGVLCQGLKFFQHRRGYQEWIFEI